MDKNKNFFSKTHGLNLSRILFIEKRHEYPDFYWVYFDTGLVVSITNTEYEDIT